MISSLSPSRCILLTSVFLPLDVSAMLDQIELVLSQLKAFNLKNKPKNVIYSRLV